MEENNQPQEQKTGIGKKIWVAFGNIIGVVVIIALIYNFFFNPQQNLPNSVIMMTQEQIQQIPEMTVKEFSQSSLDDSRNGEWVHLTDVCTFTGDNSNGYIGIYGTDLEYPVAVRFYEDAGAYRFFFSALSASSSFHAIGLVDWNEDAEICTLNQVTFITPEGQFLSQ